VMREMQAPQSGYYSSLDADSEHEEGKFYVWSREEVAGLLTGDEYAVAAACYGLDRSPNFEGKHWHLCMAEPLQQVADRLAISAAEAENRLASARDKLWRARERRIRPGCDQKILTSWNALMIHGLAHAGRVFGREDWLASARNATDFVRATLWRDGRLLATYKDGRAHLNAYLDDHAFLLAALLELMQSCFRAQDLRFARELAEALLTRFEDPEGGAFFFTSRDHEPLIMRPKPGPDNATPSGNGTAARALLRLGHLFGEPRYLQAAERTLRLFFPQMQQHASAFSSLCLGLAEALAPPTIVLLRGPEPGTALWSARLTKRYAPFTLVLAVPDSADGLPAAMDKPRRSGVNAWVCHGVNCLPPIDQWAELERAVAAQ